MKLLTVLQLCYLPSLLPPTVSNSSGQCPRCQPLYVSCLYSAMYLSRCCIIRLKNVLFCVFVFFMYCVKIIINHLLFVKSKTKSKWTNITKQKQTHQFKEQIAGCLRGWGKEKNRCGGLRGTNFQLQNKCPRGMKWYCR